LLEHVLERGVAVRLGNDQTCQPKQCGDRRSAPQISRTQADLEIAQQLERSEALYLHFTPPA
jgi:hypothetical protein